MNQADHDRVAGAAARTRISWGRTQPDPEFGGLGALLGRFRDLTPMEDRGRPGEQRSAVPSMGARSAGAATRRTLSQPHRPG
jgi:hypothetical protein